MHKRTVPGRSDEWNSRNWFHCHCVMNTCYESANSACTNLLMSTSRVHVWRRSTGFFEHLGLSLSSSSDRLSPSSSCCNSSSVGIRPSFVNFLDTATHSEYPTDWSSSFFVCAFCIFPCNFLVFSTHVRHDPSAHFMDGNLSVVLHQRSCMPLFTSVGTPDTPAFWRALALRSTFWHHWQTDMRVRISSQDQIHLGLRWQKVAWLMVLSPFCEHSSLYSKWACFILVTRNLFPTNFMSGSSAEMSSRDKNSAMSAFHFWNCWKRSEDEYVCRKGWQSLHTSLLHFPEISDIFFLSTFPSKPVSTSICSCSIFVWSRSDLQWRALSALSFNRLLKMNTLFNRWSSFRALIFSFQTAHNLLQNINAWFCLKTKSLIPKRQHSYLCAARCSWRCIATCRRYAGSPSVCLFPFFQRWAAVIWFGRGCCGCCCLNGKKVWSLVFFPHGWNIWGMTVPVYKTRICHLDWWMRYVGCCHTAGPCWCGGRCRCAELLLWLLLFKWKESLVIGVFPPRMEYLGYDCACVQNANMTDTWIGGRSTLDVATPPVPADVEEGAGMLSCCCGCCCLNGKKVVSLVFPPPMDGIFGVWMCLCTKWEYDRHLDWWPCCVWPFDAPCCCYWWVFWLCSSPMMNLNFNL